MGVQRNVNAKDVGQNGARAKWSGNKMEREQNGVGTKLSGSKMERGQVER